MDQPVRKRLKEMLTLEKYPLSAKYPPEWVLKNEMGPNALWLMEWLCETIEFKPGMRVLDMGCGKAMSSIFLAKEFDVQVWANDLSIDATDNWERICEAGVAKHVFPIHAEARSLPYAHGFFDAIVSVDSYHYYGTDDLYLKSFAKFVKPSGQIGIVVPGLMRNFEGDMPSYLERFWDPGECFSFHTVEWWRRHWEQTRLVEIEVADTQPDGWRDWLLFEEAKGFDNDASALRADGGRYLGFVRMIARRR